MVNIPVTTPVNPTQEDCMSLRPGTKVTIEGTFRGYFENTRHDAYQMSVTIGLRIDTPNGQLQIPTHYSAYSGARTTYGGGVLENLQGKEMTEGEIVRLTTFVTREHTLHGAYSQAFLLTPSEGRMANYNKLRRTVAQLVSDFESVTTGKQYRLARSLFAKLRRLELTEHEQHHIQRVMSTLPRYEQSVYGNRYIADDIAKAFNVDVEALNREQFLTFTFEVVRGVRENPTDKEVQTDQSYLFRYLLFDSPVFSHREKVSVLRASLSARFERLKGRTDEYDDYGDDQYLLERTVRFARHVDDPTIVRDIEQLAEYLISIQRQPSGTPQRMNFLLYNVLDTIEAWKREKASSLRITRRKATKWRQQLVDLGDNRDQIAQLDHVIEMLK